MKSVYERTSLMITEFETEDVITTSGESSQHSDLEEIENVYSLFGSFDRKAPGSWF